MFLLPLAQGHLFLGQEGRKDETPFLLLLSLSYLLSKLRSSLKGQKDLLAISVLDPDARKSWCTMSALEIKKQTNTERQNDEYQKMLSVHRVKVRRENKQACELQRVVQDGTERWHPVKKPESIQRMQLQPHSQDTETQVTAQL